MSSELRAFVVNNNAEGGVTMPTHPPCPDDAAFIEVTHIGVRSTWVFEFPCGCVRTIEHALPAHRRHIGAVAAELWDARARQPDLIEELVAPAEENAAAWRKWGGLTNA